MPRVKRAVHSRKKRREILEQAKGYYGARRKRLRVAKEQVMHSGAYAYRDRRDRKVLADIAVHDPNAFAQLVDAVRAAT